MKALLNLDWADKMNREGLQELVFAFVKLNVGIRFVCFILLYHQDERALNCRINVFI